MFPRDGGHLLWEMNVKAESEFLPAVPSSHLHNHDISTFFRFPRSAVHLRGGSSSMANEPSSFCTILWMRPFGPVTRMGPE